MTTLLSGLGVGFSLILAIGAQNAFVLKQGLKQQHIFWVCLICALSDSVLILLGIFGFSSVIHKFPYIVMGAKYFGALFLICYGACNFYNAFKRTTSLQPSELNQDGLKNIIYITLAFTWLNPHVYLDTVILVGAIAIQFSDQIYLFALGTILASWIFFFSLGYGATYLQPLLSKPRSWKILDCCICLVMWIIAIQLLR